MIISEKINTINNEIYQTTAQCSLDRQTAKILLYHQDVLVSMNF